MADLKAFYEVIKPKQTTLLMVTCIITYLIGTRCAIDPLYFFISSFSVFLAIAGTTALNMWLDKDIDALMLRTRSRPLPSGRLDEKTCAIYGLFLFSIGFFLGFFKINLLFSIILALGLFFDIIIYTVLLKRKSPYSIVLGGLAGAMPALAGWVAARGFIELPGLIMAALVLLWIPAHIWYLTIYFEDDYRIAGIPMLPLIVGMEKTSWIIVVSVGTMLILIAVLYLVYPFSLLYLISLAFALYFLYKAILFAKKPSRLMARKMYRLASWTLAGIYTSALLGSLRII